MLQSPIHNAFKAGVLDLAPMIIAVHDTDYNIVWANKAYQKATGLSLKEIEGKKCFSVWRLARPCNGCPVLTAIETGKQQEAELTPENQDHWPAAQGSWLSKAVPVRDAEGNIIGAVETAYEITARNRAEEALKKSELKYRLLVENQSDLVIHADSMQRIIYASPSYCSAFGKSEKELVGCDFTPLVHKEDIDHVKTSLASLANPPHTTHHEERALTVHGWRWFSWSVKAIIDGTGNISEIYAVGRDITEHKQSEKALLESEERYRLSFENVSDIIYTVDRDFKLIDMSPSVEKVLGYKPKELIGRPFQDLNLLEPEYIAQAISDTMRILKGERITSSVYAFIAKDGTRKWGEISGAPLIRDNEIVAIISVARDITERKHIEEALRRSEMLHKEAQRVAQIGHWELDSPSGTPLWSEEIFHIFGLDPKKSEPSFAAHVNIIHDEDWGLLDNSIQELSTNGTPFDIEFRIKRSNGEVRWMHARGSAHKSVDGSVTRMFGTAQDITEHKTLEKEFLRNQKLESVGLLAGGIAHDFNNILTAILGNVSMAKMQVTSEDEMFDLLSEVEKASIRAQILTKQLLTFAKGGAPVKETALIKDILKESPSFVLRGSKAGCEFSIAEDLWPAEVDVGQISHVISNIVINANQAMPDGGIIQVAAENLIIEGRLGVPVKPGRYIRISIKDQGLGIAEKHLSNIFDPYFATKQKGSGLGLATAYSIIKRHDGHITVESQLGVGTTFHIYLPASDKAVPEKEEVKLIKGQGKILVMDDEAVLSKMLGRMLGNLGYESEFAKDGAEAIEMYKEVQESEKPYDAVILDLTIPGGMGGTETIKKLLEIDPEVKAIVYSGYSDDPVLANFQEYGFKGMMLKPFKSRSLGKVLHEVLKGKGKD